MLSGKLVTLIEQHSGEIAERVIKAIKSNPDMTTFAQRAEAEMREWALEILQNLGFWLSAKSGEELKRRYQVFGRTRFEESIPLHEAVLRLQLLKEKMIGFVHEQGFPFTSIELYAEEELEMRVCRFFDAAVYHIVRGYEEAFRRALRVA